MRHLNLYLQRNNKHWRDKYNYEVIQCKGRLMQELRKDLSQELCKELCKDLFTELFKESIKD